MPQKLLLAHVLICEHVLNEKDDVCSAIRLVDLFTLGKLQPLIPLEEQGVQISVLVQVKSQVGDNDEHRLRLDLVRPNGESKTLIEHPPIIITSRAPGTPGGANIVLNVGVVASQMGVHYITLIADGHEVVRAPFTLQQGEQAATD